MDFRNSAIGQGYVHLVQRLLTGRLARYGLTANMATTMGALAALFVPLAFAFSPWAGFVVMGCSALVDSVDGQLARLTQSQSRFGAFWDSTLDRVSDCLYLGGFWVYFWSRIDQAFWLSAAFMAAMLLTLLVSYTKARIEGLGGSCGAGLMDRIARTVYLLIWALAIGLWPESPGHTLWIGLGIFTALTLWTVVQRVLAAQKNLV